MTPVWRPRGIEAVLRYFSGKLSGAAHHKKAPTQARGSEGNALAIGRERRLRVARPAVLREIDAIGAPERLQENVRPTLGRDDAVDNPLAVRRKGRGLRKPRLVGGARKRRREAG